MSKKIFNFLLREMIACSIDLQRVEASCLNQNWHCPLLHALIASHIATTPFQTSSNDSEICDLGRMKDGPRSSGQNAYFTPATPLAKSSVPPVVGSTKTQAYHHHCRL